MNKNNNNSNPIDDVIKMMLKKDAKSCKLASARLSQIEKSAENSLKRDDELKLTDSKEDLGQSNKYNEKKK